MARSDSKRDPLLSKIKRFYYSCFKHATTGTADKSSIDYHVENDHTFAVIATSSKKKKSNNPTRDPDAHVVCAVTFQVIVESKVPRYVFIHWLAVAPDSVKAPASLQVWRRNGFGHFMFQLIIKYCVALNWCYDKKSAVILHQRPIQAVHQLNCTFKCRERKKLLSRFTLVLE